MNLEEDSLDEKMEILLKRSRQEVKDTTCSAHRTLRSSSKDVRSPGMHVSEDEDEFVTPGENFQSSGKKRSIPDGSTERAQTSSRRRSEGLFSKVPTSAARRGREVKFVIHDGCWQKCLGTAHFIFLIR